MALLLATALTMAGFALAGPASAAGEGHTLYYRGADLELHAVEGAKFVRLGVLVAFADARPCAVTTDDKIWMFSSSESKPVYGTSYEASDCIAQQSVRPLAMHSATWGTTQVPIGGSMSIDERGQLWISAKAGDQASTLPAYSDIRFTDGATSVNENANEYGRKLFLLGDPRAQTAQAATVAAVPTTGAPSSDLVLPAALLAAGMIGGGLVIRGRRDRTRA